MAEAAGRDSIARQYVTGFADIFGLGQRQFMPLHWPVGSASTLGRDGDLSAVSGSNRPTAMCSANAAAWSQSASAARSDRMLGAAAATAPTPTALAPDLLAWDAALKQAGLNPGTSADLTVATIFRVARCGKACSPGTGMVEFYRAIAPAACRDVRETNNNPGKKRQWQ